MEEVCFWRIDFAVLKFQAITRWMDLSLNACALIADVISQLLLRCHACLPAAILYTVITFDTNLL